MEEELQLELHELGRRKEGRELRDRERRDVEDLEEDRDDLAGIANGGNRGALCVGVGGRNGWPRAAAV